MGQIGAPDQGPALGAREPILETRTRILDSTEASINFVEIQALEAARRGGFRESIGADTVAGGQTREEFLLLRVGSIPDDRQGADADVSAEGDREAA